MNNNNRGKEGGGEKKESREGRTKREKENEDKLPFSISSARN